MQENMERTWMVAGAYLMDAVKQLYHFKTHGRTAYQSLIFDIEVPMEELYAFTQTPEFRDYFFECGKQVDKLNQERKDRDEKADAEAKAEKDRIAIKRKRIDEMSVDARRAELAAMTKYQLIEEAREYGLRSTQQTKPWLIKYIMEKHDALSDCDEL